MLISHTSGGNQMQFGLACHGMLIAAVFENVVNHTPALLAFNCCNPAREFCIRLVVKSCSHHPFALHTGCIFAHYDCVINWLCKTALPERVNMPKLDT